jgi:hypothetical protein
VKRLRVANAVLLVAMIAGAIVTYGMKYQAEAAAEGVARLRADIAAEKDRIRTLTAEWSLLNQPSRLAAVVQEHADYFALKPFAPDQLAAIDEIPFRRSAAPAGGGGPAPVSEAARAALARIAAGGTLGMQ